jgi:hypothetical protein
MPLTNKYASLIDKALSAANSPFSIQQLKESSGWLSEVTDPPIAVVIEQVIDALRNKQPEYEPMMFDTYINEVSNAIDRCLSLRREIQDIEASSIAYARQYLRFEKTSPLNKELDSSAGLETQASELSTSMLESAGAFPGGKDTLGPALSIQAKGAAKAQADSGVELARKSKLLTDRWNVLEQIHKEEVQQHQIPGFVLNFKERRDRYVSLLRRDLSEAWKKAIAVKAGIDLTFGPNVVPSLPETTDRNALDQLVFWARDSIEFLERQRERETEFDLVIPVAQPAKDRAAADFAVGKTAVDIKTGNLLIDLGPWIENVFGETDGKLRVRSLRLRAIGASVSLPDPNPPALRSLCYPIIVFPPTTPRPLDATMVNWTVRPPIVLNARPEGAESAGVQYEMGYSVQNNPISGEWRIKFLPPVTNATATVSLLKDSPLVDLKLHLRLVGQLLNDVAKW